ncbi:hypothetical protein [Ureaplasma zalophigenitalium]|uniref:Lipoprotein n=1 Tax=Ureaplasma zalophigenitalium TaxID=907723 RepID=A0ABT3BP06_9BACT|nr:hypothetical protein [Ureaplasma zalophigenitalium]MCV3753969.1 hypothetical protein [Ureaplasma zalophigenitalium]
MNKTKKSLFKKIAAPLICCFGVIGLGVLTACSPYKKNQFDPRQTSIQKINQRYVLVINKALLEPDNNQLSAAMVMQTKWKVALEKNAEETYEIISQPTNVLIEQINGHYFLSCQVDLGPVDQINQHLRKLKQANPDKEQMMLIVPDQHFISMQIAFNFHE